MTRPPACHTGAAGGGSRLRVVALGVMVVGLARAVSRRPVAPGLGRIGKDDGYTYRYATLDPRRRHR